jgi:hypothetical protein
VQQAAAISKIVTVAKIVPIILFTVILAASFDGQPVPVTVDVATGTISGL